MKKFILLAMALNNCEHTQDQKDRESVNKQQEQYAARQPVPEFDWSLERELVIKLYQMRNQRVATHSVWRSDYGTIEGDCSSMGYGIPYDTSLTNPYQISHMPAHSGVSSIGQAEPNGVFASTNTSATWVLCATKGGLEPVYVESHVTVYPGPMNVDYEAGRVTPAGGNRHTIDIKNGNSN